MLTGIASRTLPKEENSKKVRTKHCLQSHWKNNGQKYSRNICNIFSRPRWEPLAPKISVPTRVSQNYSTSLCRQLSSAVKRRTPRCSADRHQHIRSVNCNQHTHTYDCFNVKLLEPPTVSPKKVILPPSAKIYLVLPTHTHSHIYTVSPLFFRS